MFFEWLCILLIIVIVWWYYEYYQHYKGLPTIKGLKITLPIIGNLLYITDFKNGYWQIDKYLMTIGKGKYIRGCLLHYFGVCVGDPVMIEHLMKHPSVENKSRIYSLMHRWLGTGLLTSGGKKWHTRRKLLTPAYHFKSLEQFIDVFDCNSHILVRKLQEKVGCEHTDVFPLVALCALDIICESAMGTSVKAQECSDSEYVKATKTLSTIVMERAFSCIKNIDFLYQFTPLYHTESEKLKYVHGYTESVIQSRRNELIQKQLLNDNDNKLEKDDSSNQSGNVGYKKQSTFLDILLRSSLNGKSLSDMDIREEVDTFMFEGHDTTSAALSFCVYCIAKHPHIQDKLLAEQRDIFGDNPQRKTTYDDIQRMKYLEMVVKETLRLYPSVPIFGRTVSADFTYNEFTFKRGTEIAISAYSIHRNPEIYPNPEVFDPERFTLEEISKRHPFAYLPFSAGSRNCVGQKFAMLEMKSIMGTLIRNFEFHEIKGFEVKLITALILTSENGVKVNIKKRFW